MENQNAKETAEIIRQQLVGSSKPSFKKTGGRIFKEKKNYSLTDDEVKIVWRMFLEATSVEVPVEFSVMETFELVETRKIKENTEVAKKEVKMERNNE